jgi:hypothetical protein
MTHTFRDRLLFPLLFCAALPLSVGVARADACDFTSQLNTPDAALLPYLPSSGSFGTVCVNMDAAKTTATVTFTANPGFMFAGDPSNTLDFAEEALAANIQVPVTSFPSWSGPPLGADYALGGNQVATEGMFTEVGGESSSLAFQTATLTQGGLESPTDASSLLVANSLGFDAAAHILVCANSGCTGTPTASGWVGEKPIAAPVPEPTSIALFGGVLLFTGIRLRKRPLSR